MVCLEAGAGMGAQGSEFDGGGAAGADSCELLRVPNRLARGPRDRLSAKSAPAATDLVRTRALGAHFVMQSRSLLRTLGRFWFPPLRPDRTQDRSQPRATTLQTPNERPTERAPIAGLQLLVGAVPLPQRGVVPIDPDLRRAHLPDPVLVLCTAPARHPLDTEKSGYIGSTALSAHASPTPKISNKSGDRAGGLPVGRRTDRRPHTETTPPTPRTPPTTIDRPTGRPADRPPDRSTATPTDRPTDCPPAAHRCPTDRPTACLPAPTDRPMDQLRDRPTALCATDFAELWGGSLAGSGHRHPPHEDVGHVRRVRLHLGGARRMAQGSLSTDGADQGAPPLGKCCSDSWRVWARLRPNSANL